MALIAAAAAALMLAAAAPARPLPPAPARPLPPAAAVQPFAGDWAGDGFAVRSAPTGTIVQGKCAWGKIEGPIWLDGDGGFKVSGYFNPYSSGYKLSDLGRRDQPAVFEGRITGRTLRLTLRVAEKPPRRVVLRQGAKITFPECG